MAQYGTVVWSGNGEVLPQAGDDGIRTAAFRRAQRGKDHLVLSPRMAWGAAGNATHTARTHNTLLRALPVPANANANQQQQHTGYVLAVHFSKFVFLYQIQGRDQIPGQAQDPERAWLVLPGGGDARVRQQRLVQRFEHRHAALRDHRRAFNEWHLGRRYHRNVRGGPISVAPALLRARDRAKDRGLFPAADTLSWSKVKTLLNAKKGAVARAAVPAYVPANVTDLYTRAVWAWSYEAWRVPPPNAQGGGGLLVVHRGPFNTRANFMTDLTAEPAEPPSDELEDIMDSKLLQPVELATLASHLGSQVHMRFLFHACFVDATPVAAATEAENFLPNNAAFATAYRYNRNRALGLPGFVTQEIHPVDAQAHPRWVRFHSGHYADLPAPDDWMENRAELAARYHVRRVRTHNNARLAFQPLFFRDGDRAFVRRATHNYTVSSILGRRYVRPEMPPGVRGDVPRAPIAEGMAQSAWEAVRERYHVAAVELEVFDPYRLFWVASTNNEWRLRFFWTRADFVAVRQGQGGNRDVIVGELKGNFGRLNQRDVLKNHGEKMQQVIVNAFLVSLVYRVKVTHVALVCVNRAHEVFIMEHPFDAQTRYVREVLGAFLQLRSAYVDRRGMYSEFDMLSGAAAVDRLHYPPWRLAVNPTVDPAPPAAAQAVQQLPQFQRQLGIHPRRTRRWWYAKQLGWVRILIVRHRDRLDADNNLEHYCVHFIRPNGPPEGGGLYRLVGGAAAFPGAGFMHFFPGGDPRPNMPFVDYVDHRRYPNGETVHQHAARLRLCAAVSALAGRAAALVACGGDVAPILAVFPSITNHVRADNAALPNVVGGQHVAGQRVICADHVDAWRMRQRLFIRVLHEELNRRVLVALHLGANFPAAGLAQTNPNGFRSLSQRPYWNAALKAKAEVELLPRLATWLVVTVDAAPNPGCDLFGVLGLQQAQTALKNWLRSGPLLRPA
jgi:hypothetical protein